MGGVCGTYGGEEKCAQSFGGQNLKERDRLEDLGIDGRIILNYVLRRWEESVWIEFI